MKVKTVKELGVSPTPWELRNTVPPFGHDESGWPRVVDADGSHITEGIQRRSLNEIRANARLIVASPDMYAALRDELRFLKWLLKADKKWLTERAVKRIKVIEDALRKAVGESVE